MLTWFYWGHGRYGFAPFISYRLSDVLILGGQKWVISGHTKDISHFLQAFLSAAHALRVAVPCGLNVCPPFHTISETLRPPAIIPPAKTVIEDEMRRNTFWLGEIHQIGFPAIIMRYWQGGGIAYAMERHMGTGNGWALSLDDQDICQLLPLRGDQFEQGVSADLSALRA